MDFRTYLDIVGGLDRIHADPKDVLAVALNRVFDPDDITTLRATLDQAALPFPAVETLDAALAEAGAEADWG